MSIHVTVAAIICKNNEQPGNANTKYLVIEEEVHGEIFINQPAGHLELEESLINAVVRETHEETGWHVTAEYLVGIYQLYLPEKNRQYLRFCFYCKASNCDDNPKLDDGIIRTHWLSLDELKKSDIALRSPLVIESINDFQNQVKYPLSIIHNYTK